MGSPDDIGDEEIEQVESIVHCCALEGLCKGQEGGGAPLRSHAGDGLRPGSGTVARDST
jgi:hypothetical protein